MWATPHAAQLAGAAGIASRPQLNAHHQHALDSALPEPDSSRPETNGVVVSSPGSEQGLRSTESQARVNTGPTRSSANSFGPPGDRGLGRTGE
jgi:hypothetical protein